jgi:hypothetical protein
LSVNSRKLYHAYCWDCKGCLVPVFPYMKCYCCGPGSSVSVATCYRMDGPGIESRLGRDLPHLSRPVLRPTQSPVQWVTGLSRSRKRPGCDADSSPPSRAEVLKESRAISPLSLTAFVACKKCETYLNFIATDILELPNKSSPSL